MSCRYSPRLQKNGFHIPETHIILIISAWSRDIKAIHLMVRPCHITSTVCDIIVEYTYIVPKLLFKLTKKPSNLLKATPKTATFNKQYNIIEPLNIIKGFFGPSYLCKYIKYKEKYSDNLYVAKFIDDDSFPSLLQKQCKTLKQVLFDDVDIVSTAKHPNIVEIEEIYRSQSNNQTIVVTEHCQGGNLLQRIVARNGMNNNGKWTEYDISIIMEQILKGLDFMHNEMNMNHGHLTPSKILFTNNDNLDIKMNVFGAGRYISALSKTKHFNKTIYYKSPEIIAMNKYSYSSDVFAVGIIMFLLIFGYTPFGAVNGYQHFGKYETKLVAEKITKGFCNKIRSTKKYGKGAWFPNDIKCSLEAKDFISHLLHHKIKKRYSVKFALQHPFITKRDKLKTNIISKNVIESIKDFYHHSLYKQYIMQLLDNKCNTMKSQCFSQIKMILIEMNEEQEMSDFNRFIHAIDSNEDEIDKQLKEIGIDKRYQIRFDELLSVIKDNYIIKYHKNIHSMIQKYDHYQNGFASIYQIKKLFKKYDKFNQYDDIIKIIEKQEINRCGQINYEALLMELYPNNGFSVKEKKKHKKKNTKNRIKRLPKLIIITNESFAR